MYDVVVCMEVFLQGIVTDDVLSICHNRSGF